MRYIVVILMIRAIIRHCTVATHFVQPEPEFFDVHGFLEFDNLIADILDSLDPAVVHNIYQVHQVTNQPSPQDYNLLCPFFAWGPANTVERTLAVTTQYARGRVLDTLRQHWK
jgi:hypothetical protein